MYNHNKAQQSKNRVHISWDILYTCDSFSVMITKVALFGKVGNSDNMLG